MRDTSPNIKSMNWEKLSPEHLEEMINFAGTPITRVIYALNLLSDIVDKDMIGEERDKHIRDTKIIIKNYIKKHSFRDKLYHEINNKTPAIYTQQIANDLNKKIKNLETIRDKLYHEKKLR